MIIAPGATIGIVGGGQLGRMLAVAAAQLGYRTHIFSPEASGPATEVAAAWTRGQYDDWESMRRFGEGSTSSPTSSRMSIRGPLRALPDSCHCARPAGR
jgi:hypothetical protein